MTTTPADLLAALVAADPARPVVTWYDDGAGERVELSAATTANWVAKTANLLVDLADPGPARVAALLPPHWQTAMVLLGTWAAGGALVHGVRGAAPGPDQGPVDVAFAAPDRLDEAIATGADTVSVLSLTALGMPVREVPPGIDDYASEVRVHGDSFALPGRLDPDSPALVGALGPDGAPGAVGHAELVRRAAARAAELGLERGGRLLVPLLPGRPVRPMDWLLAPLAVGGSVVLVGHPDPDGLARHAAQERTTVTL